VQNMAEEALSRGYDVTVLTHEHQGDLNGVKVIDDYSVLTREKWGLIIVHGGDVISQNIVHYYSEEIKQLSPILYLIVKPSSSVTCLKGMKNATYLGCSTIEDVDHCVSNGYKDKIVSVRHGIPVEKSIVPKTWVTPFVHFSSVGGFWNHKRFPELAATFIRVTKKYPHTRLHLYGYGGDDIKNIPSHPNISIVQGADHDKILEVIANSDIYIMNSSEEGFGLVLLEAMINRTPWFARSIAGAKVLREYGSLYTTQDQLEYLMEMYVKFKLYMSETGDAADFESDKDIAFSHIRLNHDIKNTVNDVEAVLIKYTRTKRY